MNPKLDIKNLNVGFIITGLLGLVEDDGLSPQEAFKLLEEIKRESFHALIQVKNDRDRKAGIQ